MTDIAALDDHELKVSDFYAVARRDFGTFVELAFQVLHPGKKLIPEIDSGISRTQSASTPPVRARGTPLNTTKASLVCPYAI